MSLSQALTTLRTIRHLRSSQLAWRLRYVVESRLKRNPPGSNGQSESTLPFDRLPEVPLFFRPGPTGEDAVRNLRRREFHHVNVAREYSLLLGTYFDSSGAGNRLWEITIQYHYWLYDLAEAAAEGNPEALPLFGELITEWLDAVQSDGPEIPFAWNAYAIATRASWWIRALRVIGPQLQASNPKLVRRMLHSLHDQGKYLADHIEWDLRANHVLRDAVGLAWLGRSFQGRRARSWLKLATKIGVEQAHEQVLRDGGHFERSPMYHVLVMEDVLSLALLLDDPAAKAELIGIWRRMGEYLSWVRRPDGKLPLFNDSAHDAVCDPSHMLQLGDGIGIRFPEAQPTGGKHFPDTGMAVWHGDPWSLFFDLGPVGPDYQPGHAHADSLTIECCYQGKSLIVDPGTIAYDNDSRRAYDRGTSAHNTVTIDGCDSSEVWHIFRVGRRAKIADCRVDVSNTGLRASASHSGYQHLPGAPQHHRTVEIQQNGRLIISDSVHGNGEHLIEGGFLIDPDWKVKPAPGGWKLTHRNIALSAKVLSSTSVELAIETKPYHPRFSCEVPTSRLTWRARPSLPINVCVTFESE